MVVLKVELVEANKKERISGGVYITFLSNENVKKDDYFKVYLDGKNYEFQATGITPEQNLLQITAKEVGYYATTLSHKGIDLISVLNCPVTAVTDEKEKKDIHEKTLWC